MALYFSSLNSGSNGNCYYVGNRHNAVLIDVGISAKMVEKRLEILGLDIRKIKAIIVTHEHGDHIKGLCTLAEKYDLPVYGSRRTLQACLLSSSQQNIVEDEQPFVVEDLLITGFKKLHDAADPFSFIVEYDNSTVGIFTDFGKVCNNLTKYFSLCNAAILEANYCEEMLRLGSYPYFLKARITGGRGHLSNTEALTLLQQNNSKNLQYLLLGHLSKENNCPDLVLKLFTAAAVNTQVSVASRYEASEIFYVEGKGTGKVPAKVRSKTIQLSFSW